MSFHERYLNRHMGLELGPVAVFFVANWFGGLMVATAAVMVATALCVTVGWITERKIPALGLVILALVLILGGLSLVFQDETFIKVKPTVANLLFALALFIGLRLDPSILERALGSFVFLTKKGWRVLTWRWIGLAFAGAVANEIAWRVLSSDDWVTFKTASSVGSILLYIVATRLTAPHYWNREEEDYSAQ
ncbi:MAG: septation protein IspZ [Rhodospirillales bacterium]|nr:septation protein IspZ [Rhodospirillales bacterium]